MRLPVISPDVDPNEAKLRAEPGYVFRRVAQIWPDPDQPPPLQVVLSLLVPTLTILVMLFGPPLVWWLYF